jgi:serine/threonine-protein kinase
MNEIVINQTRLKLVKGDIVKQPVEALVNAANSQLAGGGGVDGAIHRAAGMYELLALTKPLGGCPTGSAVITTAAKMPPPVKYIIHAVGPIYHDGQGNEAALLVGAYQRSLELAEEKQLHSMAFPAISTGVYGYPLSEAAAIALTTVIAYLRSYTGQNTPATSLQEIIFVLFDTGALHIYEQALARLIK